MSVQDSEDGSSSHSSDLNDESLVPMNDEVNAHNKRSLITDHYDEHLSDNRNSAKKPKIMHRDDISPLSSSEDSEDPNSELVTRALRSPNHNGAEQMPSPNDESSPNDDSINWHELFEQNDNNAESEEIQHDMQDEEDVDMYEEIEQFEKNQKLLKRKKSQSVTFCFVRKQLKVNDIDIKIGSIAKIETVDDRENIEQKDEDDEKNCDEDEDVEYKLVLAEPHTMIQLNLKKISVKDVFSFGL